MLKCLKIIGEIQGAKTFEELKQAEINAEMLISMEIYYSSLLLRCLNTKKKKLNNPCENDNRSID